MTHAAPSSSGHRTRAVTFEHESVATIYGDRFTAETAILRLAESGYNMQNVSIIGKDYTTEEVVVGFLKVGDRMNVWARTGAFWGELSGTLFSSALFVISGFGTLFVAGPIVSRVIEAVKRKAVAGGLSALGVGLYSIGIPKHNIPRYERQLKGGKFIVITHGSRLEVEASRTILAGEDHHRAESREHCAPQSLDIG